MLEGKLIQIGVALTVFDKDSVPPKPFGAVGFFALLAPRRLTDKQYNTVLKGLKCCVRRSTDSDHVLRNWLDQ
jgi:hypothetical protein